MLVVAFLNLENRNTQPLSTSNVVITLGYIDKFNWLGHFVLPGKFNAILDCKSDNSEKNDTCEKELNKSV
jgi:hypothetical protein